MGIEESLRSPGQTAEEDLLRSPSGKIDSDGLAWIQHLLLFWFEWKVVGYLPQVIDILLVILVMLVVQGAGDHNLHFLVDEFVDD